MANTRIEFLGRPLAPLLLQFGLAIAIVLGAFMCARAVILNEIEDFSVSLHQPDNRGTRIFGRVDPLSMTNPRYATLPLGRSGKTASQAGDSLLSASMALSALGVDAPPDALARWLGPEGFKDDGAVDWQRVARFPAAAEANVTLTHQGKPDPDALERALGSRPGVALLVARSKKVPKHWVFVAGFTPKSFVLYDPRYGIETDLEPFGGRAYKMIIFQKTR